MDVTSISNTVKIYVQQNPQLFGSDRQVVIALGSTGSGKSTLANFVKGNPLVIDGLDTNLLEPNDKTAI